MGAKTERRERIVDAFSVKHDCFAYNKQNHSCNALQYLVCKTEKCPFYKTKEERCRVCKETRTTATCDMCAKNGWK